MAAPALLACDWGTTNLRAWVLDDQGQPLRWRDFPLGVSALRPGDAPKVFEAEVRAGLDARNLPAVLCGMVGSNLGWVSAPYLDGPADLGAVAAAMVEPAPGVRIAPGLRCRGVAGAADVMRGEETQILGWIAADPARSHGRHVVVHPGTHAKWVVVEGGRIVRFVTAMTGELFALLRRHSVLKSDAPAGDETAFDEGVAAAGDGGALATRLFSARARVVGDGRPADETPSYLSGLLIGAELAAVPPLLGLDHETPLNLLGDAGLTAWYARVLEAKGHAFEVNDGEAAAMAGLFALHQIGDSR
jgi:2-dehydro-3-deoxygalactonokinase